MKNIVASLDQFASLPVSEKCFWYLPESLVTSLSVSDNAETLIEVGETFRQEGIPFVCAPVTPLVSQSDAYLRSGVVQRLVRAVGILQHETKGAVTLKLTDAFRPLSIQRKYFQEISQQISEREGLSGRALWERVTQFIADPDLCPPHSTGGAIDCTLVRVEDQQELDMGTPVDAIDDQANTWCEGLSSEATSHRKLLYSAMTKAGFVNLPTEWWHYSYGDQYWAMYNGLSQAIYGSLEALPA